MRDSHSTIGETTAATPASGRLFARLARTRRQLADGLSELFGGAHKAGGGDAGVFDELHERLLLADVGVEASERIINRIRRDANDSQSAEAGALTNSLRAALTEILAPCERPLVVEPAAGPFVILMVGVNGAGKTTTVAKLAARLQQRGDKVMLAACDTFRAAAIEQLQTWGQRLDIPVIAQAHGADAAAVAYDAHTAARARDTDVLLVDTAGRQHTQDDLMAQLQKIKRVLGKAAPSAPHEILLTVDAGNGHNALSQAAHFHRAVGLDGLCVAKLDGTAKGGVVVALAERFGLPIRYIGVGQEAGDLREFSAAGFVDALLPEEPGDSPAPG